ncbi:hypothetical protein AB0933_31440 [Streptomyces venezuelae]|uniref:hypothetical protein n=1 Tax=Streptomyces venezuelae TaxID=54571 RepID=UPI003456F033
MIANSGGLTGAPAGAAQAHGKPQEPENEVDDFPVMWAAPDTTARTLPWQLDPARRSKGYRTDLVLTDRRLVILGVEARAGLSPADELWSLPRNDVACAERMTFSEGAADVRLRFTDESWARLKVGDAAKLTCTGWAERY